LPLYQTFEKAGVISWQLGDSAIVHVSFDIRKRWERFERDVHFLLQEAFELLENRAFRVVEFDTEIFSLQHGTQIIKSHSAAEVWVL
jgi:hypothetical protein